MQNLLRKKLDYNKYNISALLKWIPLSNFSGHELFFEWWNIHDSIVPAFLPREDQKKLDKK